MSKVLLTEQEGLAAIMGIIGNCETKDCPKVIVDSIDTEVSKQKPGPTVTYEHGKKIEVNGKKTTTGPKRQVNKRGGAAKDDKGKETLKDLYTSLIKGHTVYSKNYFIHSTEGLVVRMVEADYTIKVTKSKELKYDINDPDFEVEKDFTTRGKAKNSAPGIAKAIVVALAESELEYTLISAKASGIILQMMGGEYTIKISKKRDRVGFEAEKGAAYEK